MRFILTEKTNNEKTMNKKIKQSLIKNYLSKQSTKNTSTDELTISELASCGFDCDTCSAEVLNNRLPDEEIEYLINKNKCPHCLNKIFIDCYE